MGGAAGGAATGGAPSAAGGGPPTGPGSAGKAGPGFGGAGGAAGIGGRATGGAGGPSPTSPFAFVTNAGTPPNVAVTASYLFWANTNTRTLMKIRVDGTGPATSIAPLVTLNAWVAADAQNVYWNGGLPGSPFGILKVGSDGGAPTFLSAESAGMSGIVVNASGVYWATTAGSVMKVGLDGGTPLLLAQTGSAAHLVADEQNVYWVGECVPPADSGCQSINKVAVAGGTPVEIFRGQGISGLAVDTTYLYWTDSVKAAVMKSALSGGAPDLALPFPINATSFAADASGLYWTAPMGLVFAASPEAPMQRLVADGGGAAALAVTLDATNVYWITPIGLGTIMKAPK
jgi:hypothetical protein